MVEVKQEKCVLILLIIIEFVIASTANSDGFCTFLKEYQDIETYLETILVSNKCYLISTCWKTQTVNNAHLVQRIKYEKRCCPGYEAKEDKCIPKCNRICQNGICTGPDQCTCNAGYTQNLFLWRCIPKCSKPCLNGVCTGPEVCNCSSGYHKNEVGVCVENECDQSSPNLSNYCRNGTCTNGVCQCNVGFVKNESSLECIPICVDCNKGICIAPNTCACLHGYQWNAAESKCMPECSKGCLNGNCVSPEECVCRQGYTEFSSSECSPFCEENCVKATCTEPNNCTCLVGYQMRKGSKHICDPVCSMDCLNGYCVEPNFCHCNTGFMFNNKSKLCEPVCNEECVNSECTSPNVCSCEPGFQRINSTHCEVLCENCMNGYCQEPNMCQCNIGYHINIKGNSCVEDECTINGLINNCENGLCSSGECVCNSGYKKNSSTSCTPVCNEECVNSECTSPNVCSCEPGFQRINSTHCEVLCENCMNGYCQEPNMCQCNIGYHINIKGNSCVEDECTINGLINNCENGLCSSGECVCNSGYKKNSSTSCTPVCNEECVNSECTSPNVCSCEPGFQRINSTYCEVLCENCMNGYCQEPNMCQCNIGYHININKGNLCVEDECTINGLINNCENGFCSSGECVCNSGYRKNSSTSCTPVCNEECVNSECTSPNVCSCEPGFQRINSTHCEVLCENCMNGYCQEPNMCQCNIGYHININKGNSCVEDECTINGLINNCENGLCSSGECVCNSGYKKNSSTSCTPVCNEECVNSECTSPNVCSCEPGFQRINSTHCEVLCENCMNGYCQEPNMCQCNIGYHINIKGNSCVEDECTINGLINNCENGLCSSGECVCNSGYKKNSSTSCTPVCNEECVNSECTSPNVCSCEPGFQRINSTHCEVLCENCMNGYCQEPNMCQCNIGYHININKGNLCVEDECTINGLINNCENGFCSSGECVCNSGYKKNSSTSCTPVCNEECVNSECTSPNVCSCEPGFQRINSTHCEVLCENCMNGYCQEPNMCQCNIGYHININKGNLCVEDECTINGLINNCENGFCSSGECVCNSGYRKNSSTSCTPVCNEECVNSECTSPNVCSCEPGFQRINSTHCEVLCENCMNGYCQEPNMCQCNIGYHININKGNSCVEDECTINGLINNCENGLCSSGECVCNSGYRKNSSTSCTPVCNEECVNSECTSPNVCSCEPGFQRINSTHCEVLCENCMNGYCQEPNMCQCNIGYHININKGNSCVEDECTINGLINNCENGLCSSGECVCNSGYKKNSSTSCTPVCNEECVNSECTSPNVCSCEPGFQRINSTHCEVLCENCMNGYCQEPNMCQCNIGYHINIKENSCVEDECTINGLINNCENGLCSSGECVCNSGYKKNSSTSCTPVCNEECVNSECTSPNVCSCEPGFQRINSTHCEVLCENCMNGYCQEPNMCQCNIGYHINIKGNSCVEDECTINGLINNCENGLCSSGECVCNSGYKKNSSTSCTPVCNEECVNSECTSPNVCSCEPGFQRINSTHCEVLCENCMNGYCQEPNMCQCNIGYHINIKGNSCVEDECTINGLINNCENGLCSSGECVCNSGYKKNSSTSCTPVCNEECVNSECTSPNACSCEPGFQRINSTHCEVLCENCMNGYCQEPNMCQCNIGYHINIKGNSCVEDECTINGLINNCENGLCSSGECVCNSGYKKNSSTSCTPVCNEECVNSECTSPNVCSCEPGFQRINSTHCEVLCENCMNGYCQEPNMCQCNIGYHINIKGNSCVEDECTINGLINNCENGLCSSGECVCNSGYKKNSSTSCTPVCNEECVNSECTSPNVCSCEPGFQRINSTHCEVLCENCMNGYCQEPNMCQCNIGYHININKGNLCVEDECTINGLINNCENGFCSSGECVCNSGYRKNSSTSCTPVCSLGCLNGYCSEPEVCECFSGYELSNGNICTVRFPSNFHWTNLWIIGIGVIVIIAVCWISIYMRYFRRVSYRCKSDLSVIYYADDNDEYFFSRTENSL